MALLENWENIMDTLLTVWATIFPVLADASSLVTQARNFIAPFLLFATSIAAITFLFRREMMQFVIFAVIAIVVFAVFYAPEFIANIGKDLGNSNKNLTWK